MVLVICYRCGRYPPVVKTAVPVDGRFEHIVISCNTTKDHEIVVIEKAAQRALDVSPVLCAFCVPFCISSSLLAIFVK